MFLSQPSYGYWSGRAVVMLVLRRKRICEGIELCDELIFGGPYYFRGKITPAQNRTTVHDPSTISWA